MILPLRRAHRFLLPVLALITAALLGGAILGRAGEPPPLELPAAIEVTTSSSPR